MEHGSNEEYPSFASGIVVHCPKIRRNNQKEQFQLINKILEMFEVTHLVVVDSPGYFEQVPPQIKAQRMKARALEGTDSFLDLPRPIKNKIERYFGGESKRKTFEIDQIRLFELMSKSGSEPMHCRRINIREEAISKNTVAILHAKIEENEELDCYRLAEKSLYSPICYLLHIYSIGQDEITFDASSEGIFEEYKNNIWVTSSTDQ